MEIVNIKFSNLLKIIATGWSLGVTAIFWAALLFGYLISIISKTGMVDNQGNPISAAIVIPTGLVLIPIVAFLQSVIISIICYLGIFIYRKIKRL
jgi:hypothetical protein